MIKLSQVNAHFRTLLTCNFNHTQVGGKRTRQKEQQDFNVHANSKLVHAHSDKQEKSCLSSFILECTKQLYISFTQSEC